MGKPRGRKSLKLSTARDIRHSISRVANMVLNGDLDPKAANTILYACNAALSAIKTDEQEKRLDELERLLQEHETLI